MNNDAVYAKGLPKDLEAKLRALEPYPDRCVQTFFKIKDKTGTLVDFTYNRPQRLHSERSQDFDFVLKARKLGISSRRIARDLWLCATRRNQHRILLTHTGEAADKMKAERVDPFISTCAFPLRAVVRADYIHFPITGSRYYVGTAGSKKFGRGDDVTGFHFAEYAHWPDPEVVGGLEQALVDKADGLIETTANGHNFAKKDWEQSKRGLNQYRAIFLPWYADEAYARDPQLEPGPITEEEAAIIAEFNLSTEQISWRRWKKRTMRDPELFPQEYPETDEQAFLSSGRPVFDWIALSRYRALVCEPKMRGYLMRRHDRIEFIDDAKGPLRVWRIPERGHVYAIGSDVAEGLQDGAFSTGEILDIGDGEQVAEWHGHIAPDALADALDLLGQWYNQALIIPESWPGPGEVTTSHLVEKRAHLWTGINVTRPGFETNRSSKTAMIAELNAALRDKDLTIRSPELLDELHAFIYDDKMAMGPSLGNFSDRVMGMGIVWHCTRDLAERVDYYKATKPSFVSQAMRGESTSVPKWSGPLPGRRRE